MKFLHTADLHLGASFPFLGEYGPQRTRDLTATFRRIVELAIREGVDFLLIAGDLFDSNRVSKELLGETSALLALAAGAGVRAVLVPGTHDHIEGGRCLYRELNVDGTIVLDSPRVEEPVEVDLHGTRVYFYGFAYQQGRSQDALSTMVRRPTPGTHVGLLHCSEQGSPEWEIQPKDTPVTANQLFSLKLDYVALGHYHEYREYRQGGTVRACYPGSPEGKAWREEGARYVALAEFSEGGVVLTRRAVNGKVLAQRVYDVSALTGAEELADLIGRDSGAEVILKATLKGSVDSPLPCDYLHGLLKGRFAHLEIGDETVVLDSRRLTAWESEGSVRGEYVRRLRMMKEESPDERSRALCERALKLFLAELPRG